jgi:glucose dehydrogenase
LSAPVLADVRDNDGEVIPGVVGTGKIGQAYVHDREDCRLIRFSVDGRQYIVVAAGGNVNLPFKRGNNIIAFALD